MTNVDGKESASLNKAQAADFPTAPLRTAVVPLRPKLLLIVTCFRKNADLIDSLPELARTHPVCASRATWR